jgi:uncharacterized membrane protein
MVYCLEIVRALLVIIIFASTGARALSTVGRSRRCHFRVTTCGQQDNRISISTCKHHVTTNYRGVESPVPWSRASTRGGLHSVMMMMSPVEAAGHSLPAFVSALAPPSWMVLSGSDKWAMYSIVACSAALGLRLERTTAVGKSLSGPVTAMLITATLTNLGILPATGSIHITALQGFVVKLATPLLLLGADMRKIFKETGILLKAFALGTVGTLAGSTIGYSLVAHQLNSIGAQGDGWKIASALTAKNVGGGLNFIAVSDSLGVSPLTIGTGLAIDNLLGLLYFPLISYLGTRLGGGDISNRLSSNSSSTINADSTSMAIPSSSSSSTSSDNEMDGLVKTGVLSTQKVQVETEAEVNMETYTTALALGFIVTAVAEALSSKHGISPVPIASLIAVLLASTAKFDPKMVSAAEAMGKLLLLLFFGSIGNSSGTIASAMTSTGAGALLIFGLTLYAVHLGLILALGKFLKIPIPDILIASNANIGNAATASALATGMGWRTRLVPALLVGTFGNAIGTFAGLALGQFVLKRLAGL